MPYFIKINMDIYIHILKNMFFPEAWGLQDDGIVTMKSRRGMWKVRTRGH